MIPKHTSTSIGERGETTWDLVALGDSTPTGKGVAAEHSYVQVYAGYIEDDLGVDVTVHSWATNKTLAVADWVDAIRRTEGLQRDLRDANVITMWLGWHDVIPRLSIGRGSPSRERPYGVDVGSLDEVTSPMKEAFDSLLSHIVSLATPDETLILVADVGIPALFVERWKVDGTFDVLKQHAYEAWRDYLVQAASRHGVHVVRTYEVINGPSGDQPLPSEYWQPDRLHFSEQGHRLIADLHREVGYRHSRAERIRG
jgi:lysophospholipase L1-like esterase